MSVFEICWYCQLSETLLLHFTRRSLENGSKTQNGAQRTVKTNRQRMIEMERRER